MHGFSGTGELLKFTAEHVNDIYMRGIFFSQNDSSSQKDLSYTKLPEHSHWIRLLEYRRTSIFPLLRNHSPEFNIHIFPLGEAPPYTAVSYMWGDSVRSKSITIQDGTTYSPLPITASAMECLVALQSRRRYLWIDSICINQSDEDEKMKQAGIMRDIYSAAAEVVAVLGNSVMARASSTLDHDTSEILRHSYRHYRSVAEYLFRESMLGRDDHFVHDPRYLDFHLNMVFNNRYPLKSRVLRLLCHPYWTRVWIVQEIAVANSVVVYLDGSFRNLESCFEAAEAYRTIADAIAGPSTNSREIYQEFLSEPKTPSDSSKRVSEAQLLKLYSRGVERLLSIRDIRSQYHNSKRSIEIQDVMLLSMNSVATDSRD